MWTEQSAESFEDVRPYSLAPRHHGNVHGDIRLQVLQTGARSTLCANQPLRNARFPKNSKDTDNTQPYLFMP